MATNLTETAYLARRVIKYGTFFIIFLIVGRILFGVAYNIYRHYRPKPPPSPNFAFGKLPQIKFPQSLENLPNEFSLKLETPKGTFPNFSTTVNVYFSPKPGALFSSLDNAKQKARSLGFLADGERQTDILYTFTHIRSAAKLTMDIISGSFSISYDLAADPSLVTTRPLSNEVAASNARAFLSAANLLPDDLGAIDFDHLKTTPEGLKSAISLSESNFVRVNFFRKDYDEKPVVGPVPGQANIWLLVSGARERERQIVAGQYLYFPVDSENPATYPIKNIEVAWEELRTAKAYTANLGGAGDGQVTIRRIYLAYYDAPTPQEFMQPIYVFEGDKGFIAYVSAVADEAPQSGK